MKNKNFLYGVAGTVWPTILFAILLIGSHGVSFAQYQYNCGSDPFCSPSSYGYGGPDVPNPTLGMPTYLLENQISSEYASPYPEIPRGSYLETCRPYMEGATLVGRCLNLERRFTVTRLENANLCNFVQNINGVLTCTGGWK